MATVVMYGWRARIGCIVPSSGTVTEMEWRRSVPDGVIVLTSRVLVEDVTVAGVRAMIGQFERAARELATARVNVIVQVGTPVGLVSEDPELLASRLYQLTKIPTVTMFSACVDALRSLNVQRLAVVTPYIETINSRLRASLQASGFSVSAISGLGLSDNFEINALPPESSYRAVHRLLQTARDVQAVFISCAGWRTFEVLESLERDLGVPVVSSSSAGLWKALTICNLGVRTGGLGHLFAQLPVTPCDQDADFGGGSSGGQELYRSGCADSENQDYDEEA